MPKINDQISALKLVATGLIKEEVISDKEFYYRILDILYEIDKSKFKELNINYFDTEEGKYSELVKFARSNNLFLKNKEPNVDKVLKIIRKKILEFKNITWD